MHYRRIFLCLASASCTVPIFKSWTQPTFEDQQSDRESKASRLAQQFMVKHGLPGLAVGVSLNGRCVWSEGFGCADVEQMVPCTKDTVMRIASISKPITATIAARLVQDGKLKLDAAVQDYIPNFPRKKYDNEEVQITVRQLLSHTSGIRHYNKPKEPSAKDILKEVKAASATGIDDNVIQLVQKTRNKYLEICGKDKKSLYRTVELKDGSEFFSTKSYDTISDALDIFQADDLIAKPGSAFNYTTHGYTLLSAVLEKCVNQSYAVLVKKFFADLGMIHSSLDLNRQITPNRANFHASEGANGIKKPLLDAETIKTFWKGEITDKHGRVYALGWFKLGNDEDYGGTFDGWKWHQAYVHTGAAVGASSVLLIKPESNKSDTGGVCVAVLTNLHECSGLTQLAFHICAIFAESLKGGSFA